MQQPRVKVYIPNPFLGNSSVNTFPEQMNRCTTIEVLLETGFSTRSVLRSYKEDNGATKSVLFGTEDLCMWSSRISTVTSHCQGTVGEDTAGCKKLSEWCSELWSVEISDGTIIIGSYRSWMYKWSIKPISNPNPVYSHPYTWQYFLLEFDSLVWLLFWKYSDFMDSVAITLWMAIGARPHACRGL
jgi:hypothetical protein